MAMSIFAIQNFLASNTGITALVPAGNICLDVAPDTATPPFITLTVVSQKQTFLTEKPYLAHMQLQIAVYASTLSACDSIVTAIQEALVINAPVTGNAWGVLQTNGPIPRGLVEGYYSAVLEYRVDESLSA